MCEKLLNSALALALAKLSQTEAEMALTSHDWLVIFLLSLAQPSLAPSLI